MTKYLLLTAGLLLAGFSVSPAQDVFDASPEVVRVKPRQGGGDSSPSIPPKAQRVRLKVGQIVEVFHAPRGAKPEWAFYLPPEGTRIAQVVKEKSSSGTTYFLKAHARGSSVGGVVLREYLDRPGYRPNNVADEARIQAGVRRTPVYIEVK